MKAVVALLLLGAVAQAKKSHYLKQAGGSRPARVEAYDGTECLIKDDAERFSMCIDHAIDWQIGFEWTQLSSSEFIAGDHYDYFTIQFSLYSEQELELRPYNKIRLQVGTEVDYQGEIKVAFDQFKA